MDITTEKSCGRVSRYAFHGVMAMLFVISSAITIAWCAAMSAMHAMPMPGGWSMSMAWMRLSGQSWAGAAVAFLGMWSVMMVAMMLPSLFPMLRSYRRAVDRSGEAALGRLTLLVGLGYYGVWSMIGLAVYPLGVALAAIEMAQPALARAVPFASGSIVLLAGLHQFTPWKRYCLACCRAVHGQGRTLSADAVTAWRYGLRIGMACVRCCFGQMAILLAIGVMDPLAMAAVTAAMAAERLAPAGDRVARATGAITLGVGAFMITRAAGFV